MIAGGLRNAEGSMEISLGGLTNAFGWVCVVIDFDWPPPGLPNENLI